MALIESSPVYGLLILAWGLDISRCLILVHSLFDPLNVELAKEFSPPSIPFYEIRFSKVSIYSAVSGSFSLCLSVPKAFHLAFVRWTGVHRLVVKTRQGQEIFSLCT